MEKYKFFLILTCMTCLFYISCEKTGIQTTETEISDEQKISTRTVEDCEDCPVDYCCCSIELWSGTEVANLQTCGFSNGTYECGTFDPPGNCSDFHGFGDDFILEESPGNPRVIVCKEENGFFRIYNNTNAQIVIRMTCQADVTVPVFVLITIPAFSFVYYSTDGSCLLSECE